MTGTTTPDGLRYPDDYNQPADSPSAFQALAGDVQAALVNRATVTQLADSRIRYGTHGGSGAFDPALPVNTVEPAWTYYLPGLRVEPVALPGAWLLEASCNLEITGGTSSPQGAMVSMLRRVAGGADIPWNNDAPIALGRLTAPPGQRIISGVRVSGYIANPTGFRFDMGLSATRIGSVVAGASVTVSNVRLAYTFHPHGVVHGAALWYG